MKKDIKSANIAWDLFTQTGEFGYYMLYKNLTSEDDEDI